VRASTRGQSLTGQVNLTSILGSQIVNEARVAYLNGDPVTLWEADVMSTTYTRAGSVPFTVGQSRVSDLFGRQAQFSDTLSWNRGKHTVRLGTSIVHHSSGGTGNEPGFAILGTVHVPQHDDGAAGQLTLADVQQYSQPNSYGVTELRAQSMAADRLRAGQLQVQRRSDARSRPALRPADVDRCDEQLRAACRVRLASQRRPALAIRGGYGLYYTQIAATRLPARSPAASTATPITRRRRTVRIPVVPGRAMPAAAVRSEVAAAVAAAGA
jgi:hypothetical protein